MMWYDVTHCITDCVYDRQTEWKDDWIDEGDEGERVSNRLREVKLRSHRSDRKKEEREREREIRN